MTQVEQAAETVKAEEKRAEVKYTEVVEKPAKKVVLPGQDDEEE